MSSSITSIPWITSGNDVLGDSNNLPNGNGASLTNEATYVWQITVQDSNGNSTQTQTTFVAQ